MGDPMIVEQVCDGSKAAGLPEGGLLPDCGGLIRRIAFSVPPVFLEARPSEWYRPLVPIGNLLQALVADIEVFVLVEPDACASAEAWIGSLPLACPLRIIPVEGPARARQSPWTQDLFHVRAPATAADEQGKILARPGARIGPTLAAALGWQVADPGVDLDGGNQLVGPDFRLIGRSAIAGEAFPPGDGGAGAALLSLDPRPVHLFAYRASDLGGAAMPVPDPRSLKGVYQCGFHVDQYVTVTGLRHAGQPLLIVAEAQMADAGTSPMVEQIGRQLDASARRLADQGFAVRRNPVPFCVTPDSGKRLPRLYNNLVLENAVRPGGERPLVFLPQFADVEPLDAYDAANRALWEELGFAVVPVHGFSQLASRNGALRCISKIVQRQSFQFDTEV
ncbi:hypothetical protein [Rhizobium straminoryzae]|uniref:Agmatine deiminase family protein n=1 Tax=Rhizobium straminoryzae TaxID=1387186 RepID=A0A549SRK9_9HYPH|nr:hypothetical protein [Rhizobium straminoryzae]TRL32266.1 hypothetical protein FNA46_23675 [Rhizobium straminoryzae]